MRSSKKLSTALVLLVAVAAAAAIAGCGGGSDSGGGGGDPITLAPKDVPVYVEANLAPSSQEVDDLNGLVDTVVGIEDLGGFIAEEIEKSALDEGEKIDFEGDIEPWLGERAGFYSSELEDGDLQGYGLVFETTDAGEAEDFIKARTEEGDGKTEEGEFEGVKYYIDSDGETAVGVIDGFLVIAEDKAGFEEMVKTSNDGENLGGSPKYKKAIEASSESGIGRAYVDIGGLIAESGSQIPPETEAFFDASGIDPTDATAVVTGIPHSDEMEIDVSTNALGAAQAGDASALLESLPATALGGFASPDVGKALEETLAKIEKEGLPGELGPGELGPALESKGIDLKSILAPLGDVAVFAEGSSIDDLGGAMVIETDDPDQARNTVSNLGLLLQAGQTPGVTPLKGNLTGFSITSSELGPQSLIIGAEGEKLVVAYGMDAAEGALGDQAKTLGSTPGYEAAKSALGSTPMGFYVDGGPTLDLVRGLLSPEEAAEFSGAEPYVEKIAYIGSGSEVDGDSVDTKIVVGLEK